MERYISHFKESTSDDIVQQFEDMFLAHKNATGDSSAYDYQMKTFIPFAVGVSDSNVIKAKYCEGLYNKCERNAFGYAHFQNLVEDENITVVKGYIYTKGKVLIDHYWCYNLDTKKHLEVTPFRDGGASSVFYIGIILDKRIFDKCKDYRDVIRIDFEKHSIRG